MEITFKELECLVKIAQAGSFSQAASELNLSQPTLSNHIIKLERSTGLRLLKRSRNSLKLTGAGEIIYRNALNIVHLLEKTKSEIEDLKGLKTGTLKIAGSTIPGTYILPEMIKKFKSSYKGIIVKLNIKDTHAVIDDVQKGEIDLGVVGYSPPKPLFRKQVAEDEIVIAVNSAHSWFKKDHVSLETVLEEPLLIREAGSGTQRFFIEAVRKKTNKKLKVFSTVSTSEAMKMSVIAGLAPGIISKIAIKDELKNGILKAINIRGLSFKRPFYVIVKNLQKASVACKAFIDVFEN